MFLYLSPSQPGRVQSALSTVSSVAVRVSEHGHKTASPQWLRLADRTVSKHTMSPLSLVDRRVSLVCWTTLFPQWRIGLLKRRGTFMFYSQILCFVPYWDKFCYPGSFLLVEHVILQILGESLAEFLYLGKTLNDFEYVLPKTQKTSGNQEATLIPTH